MQTVGIDIGGSSVKGCLLRQGESASEPLIATSPMYSGGTPEVVRAAVAGVLQALGVAKSAAPLGAGMCVPGLLSPDRTSIERSVNLPALEGVPLASLLPAHLGLRCVMSDAVCAAVDVQALAGAKGRLFALVLGTGVGAAVLDDGVPLRVSGDGPGHFGQLDVSGGDPHAPSGPDGGRGSLEAYCGAAAWPLDTGADPMRQVRALAQAIRIGHALYRPLHVAVLGGTALRWARVRPVLESTVRLHLTGVARPGWQMHWAVHAHHAAVGAARLAAATA